MIGMGGGSIIKIWVASRYLDEWQQRIDALGEDTAATIQLVPVDEIIDGNLYIAQRRPYPPQTAEITRLQAIEAAAREYRRLSSRPIETDKDREQFDAARLRFDDALDAKAGGA